VALSWTAPPFQDGPVSSYVIEAGSSPGLVNLAHFNTGNASTSLTAPGVPNGTYYVRVKAVNASGVSASSNEVVAVVGAGGCANAPNAPAGLGVVLLGSSVTLTWSAPIGGCSPTSYVLEAGSAPGLANLANANVGSTLTYTATGVGAGIYYVRVRAANAFGNSGPSNEVQLTVGVVITSPNVVGTDATWSVDIGGTAALIPANCISNTYAPAVEPARWIWYTPCTASDTDRRTFSKQFTIGGGFSSVRLSAAADNYAFVAVNGQGLPTSLCVYPAVRATATICGFSTLQTFDITGFVHVGPNTIAIDVVNAPIGRGTGWGNPAGVLARLVIQ